MTSPDGLSRGVPAQDLLENQDPAVLFNVDDQTGEVTPIEVPGKPEVKKRAAAKAKTPSQPEEAPSDPGAGE